MRFLYHLTLTVLVATVAVSLVSAEMAGPTNERGIDPANFDTTCAPCTDFFQFANGTWVKNNPVPSGYSMWSVWNEIAERNNGLLREILESSAADNSAPKWSNTQLIGDFYATAMDTSKIEQLGLSPLKGDIERIKSMTSVSDLVDVINYFHAQGFSVLFDSDVEQDLKDNTIYRLYITQGGLGLPEKEYYTREDEESVNLRDQYTEHIGNMLMLGGYEESEARSQARKVMALETRLANASLSAVEWREPENWYNLMTVGEADAMTPNFSWGGHLRELGLGGLADFSCNPNSFFKEMNTALTEVPLDEWKSYLMWHLLKTNAPYLSSEFVDEDFRFDGTILQGTKELRPRWKRVLSTINWRIGEALGKLYVERAFPPEAKASALEMIGNIQAALKDRIDNLNWMSPATREKALAKLATFNPKIGYPDKWRDYSGLDIRRDSYVDNIKRHRDWWHQYQLNRIGKPIDKEEWGMPPQIVNAYYNPLLNEIVFPAAILQPPFFDPNIDDPINYGAIGAVIGHEMIHGYDDQGAEFDETGNMKNWWTEEDKEKFEVKTNMLVDQFNGYKVTDDVNVNGQLTLGENIADLGGLTIAYYGLQKALQDKHHELIDGFTPEQRFFLSWAQAWRVSYLPEALVLQVRTDPHSPGMYRTNGPLSNMREFHEAFGCDAERAMVRSDSSRVEIW